MRILLAEERGDGGGLSPERSFDGTRVRLGREELECEIVFDSAVFPGVSRLHAELRVDNGKWALVDLDSRHGTFLDGRRIGSPEPVVAGSRIQLGVNGPFLRVIRIETGVREPSPPPPPPSTPAPSPVQPSPVAPRMEIGVLEFVDEPGRHPISLNKTNNWLGREPAGEVVINGSAFMVSRKHAAIRLEDHEYILEDNGSFNGTLVNEQRISTPTPLYHNDQIRLGLGGPVLRFVSPSRVAPQGASLAGQRSVAVGQAAVPSAGQPKTMVFKVDRASTERPLKGGPQPQLLMSLTFGNRKELRIGRDESNDIRLDGLQISNRHARLLLDKGDVVIDDLDSTNGVYLNGDRVSRQVVTTADAVQIGSFLLRLDPGGYVCVFDTRSKTRIDAVAITKEVKDRSGGGLIKLLDAVSISIQPNEFVGLLGPSGAGKSTLMDAMNGMRPGNSGAILINNLDLYQHLDVLKQSIGYVPQDDIIHRELTVYRTLFYVAKLRLSSDVSNAEIDRTIDEVLDVTGLTERRNVPIDQLSGGQRKRVSIAVELITKPSIIFLDEPTSGLDPATEEKIMKLFRQIAESGRTVILTTHAMENVKLFDKLVLLMQGRLAFYGKPDETLTHLNATSFKDLYDKLEEPIATKVAAQGESYRRQATAETADEWKQKFLRTPQYNQYVYEPLKELDKQPSTGVHAERHLGVGGALRQWLTLSRRYAEVLLGDKLNLFILFAQAPVIALLVFFVMGDDRPRDFVYFMLSLVAIWFGTSVAAREVIRERPIYKRERMVNLGIVPYLGSKLFVLGVIVGLQCLLLFLPLKFFDLTGLMPMPGAFGGIPQFWAMLLTAGVGIALGLLISAIVKTSEMATSLVPLILIPQILFAGLIGVPTGINKVAGLLMPATWSFDTMKRYSTLGTLETIKGEPPGLYKRIEQENDKIIADAREDLKAHQKKSEDKLDKFEDKLKSGQSPKMPKLDDPPTIAEATKVPEDLSGYVTFLHPWMHGILNELVLILMFYVLMIAAMIALRRQDTG